MPGHYARATALSNVGGRIDYISSPERQEHLLAFHDSAADLLDGQFWPTLASECRTAFEQYGDKTKKCCEGREIMQPLSNALLQRMEPKEIAKIIADEFREKLGLTVAVAVHQNSKEINLHAHIIFPERQLLQEPVIKVAERALFFDAEGKRRYKKSEILDADKQLLPGCRIVKKGEIYESRCFGSVDPKYSKKAWLESTKTDVLLPLINGKLKGDVEFTKFDPSSGKLPLQHVGNVKHVDDPAAQEKAAQIEAYNQRVKEFNALVDAKIVPRAEVITLRNEVRAAPQKNGTIRAVIEKFRGAIVHWKEHRAKREETERLRSYYASDAVKPKIAAAPKVKPEPAQPVSPPPSFAALIAASIAYMEKLDKLTYAQKELGQERRINRAVIDLPVTLKEAVRNMGKAHNELRNVNAQIFMLKPPSAPGIFAGSSKKEQHRAALAEYHSQLDMLQKRREICSKAISDNLETIMPHLSQQERVKQGHGKDAPVVSAENISEQDIFFIQQRIEFKCQKTQPIAKAALAERSYEQKLGQLYNARRDVETAQTRFDNLLKEIPPEHRTAAREAVGAALEAYKEEQLRKLQKPAQEDQKTFVERHEQTQVKPEMEKPVGRSAEGKAHSRKEWEALIQEAKAKDSQNQQDNQSQKKRSGRNEPER